MIGPIQSSYMYEIDYKNPQGLVIATATGKIAIENIQRMIFEVTQKCMDQKEIYILLDYTAAEISIGDTFFYTSLTSIKEEIEVMLKSFDAIYAAHVAIKRTTNDILIDLFKRLFDKDSKFHLSIHKASEEAYSWLLKSKNEIEKN